MCYDMKQLEVNLMAEFKKRPNYHIEALYFITQGLTNSAPVEGISKLIVLLKAKTGTIEQTMKLIQDCLIIMAEYDSTFRSYLKHFPGEFDYEEQPPTHAPGASKQSGGIRYYPSMPNENPSMDDRLTDGFIINLHNHLDVTKLDDFAVVGLHIPSTMVNNTIAGCTTAKEKFSNLLNLWKREAPIESMELGGGMPSYTKRGLRKALERAKLNDAITSLNL